MDNSRVFSEFVIHNHWHFVFEDCLSEQVTCWYDLKIKLDSAMDMLC